MIATVIELALGLQLDSIAMPDSSLALGNSSEALNMQKFPGRAPFHTISKFWPSHRSEYNEIFAVSPVCNKFKLSHRSYVSINDL